MMKRSDFQILITYTLDRGQSNTKYATGGNAVLEGPDWPV